MRAASSDSPPGSAGPSRPLRPRFEIYSRGEPALKAAATARDTNALVAACHSLRGACAAIGANALQQGLLAIETSAHHGPPGAGLPPMVQRVQANLLDLVWQLSEALRA